MSSNSMTAAASGLETKKEKPSLLTLPRELRNLILQEVLPKDTINDKFPRFVICGKVYDTTHRPAPNPQPPNHTAILYANRQLHHESLDVLYAQSIVQVDVTITDHLNGLQDRHVVRVHDKIDSMAFWSYVRNLKLTIKLRKGTCSCCALSGVKIRELAEALDGGKMLKKLHVRIDWNDFEGMPLETFEEALRVLGEHFDLSGIPSPKSIQKELVVEIAGDMDVEEKMAVEEHLKCRMMVVSD